MRLARPCSIFPAIVLATILGTKFISASLPDPENPKPMETVRRAAWQLVQDTATLARAAHAQGDESTEAAQEVIARLDDLKLAAEHFQKQTTVYKEQPAYTADDFLELQDAFRRTRPHLRRLGGSGAVQEAIRESHLAMIQLITIYRGKEEAKRYRLRQGRGFGPGYGPGYGHGYSHP